MKTAISNTLKATMAMAATSLALVGPAHAQNAPSLPIPIPDPEPKQTPEPAPSSSIRITGTVHRVDGHLLTLTDGEQLIFIPGMTKQTGELTPGATIKASYAETAGRKVVTSIHVDPL